VGNPGTGRVFGKSYYYRFDAATLLFGTFECLKFLPYVIDLRGRARKINGGIKSKKNNGGATGRFINRIRVRNGVGGRKEKKRKKKTRL